LHAALEHLVQQLAGWREQLTANAPRERNACFYGSRFELATPTARDSAHAFERRAGLVERERERRLQRAQGALLQVLQQVLGAVEKLVEGAAAHASPFHDARHRNCPMRQHLRRGQQQPFAVLRVALRATERTVVGTTTRCGKVNRKRH
jgi:hypothetical protein